MTAAVALLVAAGAVAVVVANGSRSPGLPASANRLPAVTLSAYLTHRPLPAGTSCPATRPPVGGASLPRAVVRQIGSNQHYAFGRIPIWVLLAPWPAVRLHGGRVYLKVIVVVSGTGTLRIVGRPIDGRPGRVSANVPGQAQTGPPHAVPTSITVSRAGCYDVAAVYRGNPVQWVWNAAAGRGL